MEELACREGLRELWVRLEERVEKRGAKLQQLFSEYGLRVDAWRLRSAARDAVFFNLPLSLLCWYGSLILEVSDGLTDAGHELEDLLQRGLESVNLLESVVKVKARPHSSEGRPKALNKG